MAFLHGVETIPQKKGAPPVQEVKTAIIGLVGIAPIGPANALTVITNERQAADTFGEQLPGFTIPQALAAIFSHKAGRVVVVNTLKSGHLEAVSEEEITVASGKATLDAAPIGAITLTSADGEDTYILGTHYSITAFGVITILDLATIPEGTDLLASYDKLNISAVIAADIVGSASSPRTGFKLFAEAFTTFGYNPKILIAPKFCEMAAVAAEMASQALALRAIDIVDAPSGTAVATAITGRGPSGTLAGFQSSSDRRILTYPYMKAYDPATNADQIRPLSQFVAGLMAWNDQNRGYWFSPSNLAIQGITGVEKTLTFKLDDPNSETNQLNEVGIFTYKNSFGSGIKGWGNRSAAFPSSTEITNFISVRRVHDVLDESVLYYAEQFNDQPINRALIDSIKASVNAFIRTLIGRGALVDGFCEYNDENNPPEQIAAGHLVFEIISVAPPPAERITFNSFVDVNLLKAVNETV